MRQLWVAIGRIVRQEDGQDLVEYGMLAALISVFAIGVVTILGETIRDTFWDQVARLAQNLNV